MYLGGVLVYSKSLDRTEEDFAKGGGERGTWSNAA